MSLTVGQVLNNRYRIDALLGQGGMGAVYRALDSSLNLTVAIKENLYASSEAQKQFGREAKILAHLSHPNLPRVTDHFFIPGHGQYLVMDFIEGQDLQAMLDLMGVLPENMVLAWILQICDALTYLHGQPTPIIHRDVKPANIRIRPDGHAMLVDFGIAKIYDPQMATTMGAKAVAPGYSPPEQYAGKTDARSDIYALGATIYHLLTGHTLPASVMRMGGSAQTKPRQFNKQISPQTEQAILKAIEVSADRRFQTVEELRAALPQPTSTPPPSPSLPLGVLVGGAGLALVVLAIAVVTLTGTFRGPRYAPAPVTHPAFTVSSTPSEILSPPILVSTLSPIPPSATPTPTTLSSTPTAFATRTPTPFTTTTPPAVPVPVLSHPSAGEGIRYARFQWQGTLSPGLAYMVTVIYNDGQPIITSPPLLQTSWDADLPAAKVGEWNWSVSVVNQSNGRVVARSNPVHFWYSPLGGFSPLPTPQP